MTRPVWYEIRVRGRMGGMLLVAFPDLSAQADGTETVLTGALGLELLELHRTGT